MRHVLAKHVRACQLQWSRHGNTSAATPYPARIPCSGAATGRAGPGATWLTFPTGCQEVICFQDKRLGIKWPAVPFRAWLGSAFWRGGQHHDTSSEADGHRDGHLHVAPGPTYISSVIAPYLFPQSTEAFLHLGRCLFLVARQREIDSSDMCAELAATSLHLDVKETPMSAQPATMIERGEVQW